MKGRGILMLLVLAAVGLMAAGVGSGATSRAAVTTRVVDDDLVQCPSAGYTSIRAAVAAAAIGDTIQVCPGTYNESVKVAKKLTIKAQFPTAHVADCITDNPPTPDPTIESIVQGRTALGFPTVTGSGPAFDIRASGVTIDGFVIQNSTTAMATPPGPPGSGAFGITTQGGFGSVTITHNLIQNNAGGVYLNSNGGTSKVNSNCFRSNNLDLGVAPASGNGIYSDQGLNGAQVQANQFFDNQNAATIFVSGFAGPPNTTKLDFSSNISDSDGTGIILTRSTLSKINSNIIQNALGSGIFIGPGNSGLQVNANIVQNSGGRGIHVNKDNASYGIGGPNTGLTISANIAQNNATDGFRASFNSLKNSTVARNIFNSNGDDGLKIKGSGGPGANQGNKIQSNIMVGNGGPHDCHDGTPPTNVNVGPSGNTWTGNIGNTQNRKTLCLGAVVVPPFDEG
jgi:hypothetical protein